MTCALIVVDVQQGFRNSYTEPVLPQIVQAVGDHGGPVLFTRFINHTGSVFERLLSWSEMKGGAAVEIVPELLPLASSACVFDKSGYSALKDERFSDKLRELCVDSVELCGFDTDACVLATALDTFEAGYGTFVRAECCASSGGQHFHEMGLQLLARNLGKMAIKRGRTNGSTGDFA